MIKVHNKKIKKTDVAQQISTLRCLTLSCKFDAAIVQEMFFFKKKFTTYLFVI